MPEQAPWEKYAPQDQGPWAKYATPPPAATPEVKQQAPTPTMSGPRQALEGAIGGLKGLGSSIAGATEFVTGLPISKSQTVQKALKPSNQAQSIGRTGEQVLEFLAPGGLEGKATGTLARIATEALTTAGINKAQGGSLGAGAAAGALGGAVGRGLEAVAPKIANWAIGAGAKYVQRGSTPGKAVLEELPGAMRAGTIAKKASEKSLKLTGQMETAVQNSLGHMSTQDAIAVVDREIAKGMQQNAAGYVNKLQSVREQLTRDLATGRPLPTNLPAKKVLALKRGVSKTLTTWAPEERKTAKTVIAEVYGALDKQLDRIPGNAQLNQRIQSLINASNAAKKSVQSNPHGALAAGIRHVGYAGAGVGYSMYSGGYSPGSVAKGVAEGLLAERILMSPAGKMVYARLVKNFPVRVAKALTLQIMRDESAVENPVQGVPQNR